MFKKNKTIRCQACEEKIPQGDETADIRFTTSEGVMEMIVCNKCADIVDKLREGLLTQHKQDYENI